MTDRMSRRDQTTAIKRAIKAQGFNWNVSVRHGTGTAWSWMTVRVDQDPRFTHSGQVDIVESIAKIASGRGDMNGEWGSKINVTITR